MAATKNHDYHLVEPDPWPIIGAFCGLALFSGLVMWWHDNPYGKFVFALGVIGVLVTMYNWWSNTIREAHTGHHTPVVQLHLRYGMILFIASEVMFFLAWFWAFFDSSLFPSAVEAVGGQWPPKGILRITAAAGTELADAYSSSTFILLFLEKRGLQPKS